MQSRITFTIGLDINRNGMDIPSHEQDIIARRLEHYMSDNFGGATFLVGRGVWNGGPSNSTVSERILHIIVDLWMGNLAEIQNHAQNLALLAEQNSVHMSMAAMYAVNVSNDGVITDGS